MAETGLRAIIPIENLRIMFPGGRSIWQRQEGKQLLKNAEKLLNTVSNIIVTIKGQPVSMRFHIVLKLDLWKRYEHDRDGCTNAKTEFIRKHTEIAKATKRKYELMKNFLQETNYTDYSSENIQTKVAELFSSEMTDLQKAKTAYEFVRDEIPHSFDCNAGIITAKASDVLKYKTGICHAKANLLAALLRSQGIPTGFCFQHITLADDDSLGYCVHAYNAVFVDGKWIHLDARGNKPGVNAQFSVNEPILAFPIRPEYDEYFWKGIYASSHIPTMKMLEAATCLQDVIDYIPDEVTEAPDLIEGVCSVIR